MAHATSSVTNDDPRQGLQEDPREDQQVEGEADVQQVLGQGHALAVILLAVGQPADKEGDERHGDGDGPGLRPRQAQHPVRETAGDATAALLERILSDEKLRQAAITVGKEVPLVNPKS